MRVRDCMTARVVTLEIDKKLIVVQETMGFAHIRHIPVVDKGRRVVGVISHRDLLHAAISSVAAALPIERRQHLWAIPIADVMRTDVQTIGPDASIQEAAVKMRAGKIGCLPVVEGGKLVGIISEYDLLGFVAGMPEPAGVG
ncbi:MAG TPA: CBS domain-containing protein [Gemmatimonadales bacterium]